MIRCKALRLVAAGILLTLLIATFAVDSITATLGLPVAAAIVALIMGALHPEADGRLARWAMRQGMRDRVGATAETYPEYVAAKGSVLVRVATLAIILLIVAVYSWTR